MIDLFYLFLIFLILIFFLFSFIAVLNGAPFVPAYKKAVDLMVVLAQVKSGEKAVDLGSGDGRIVIALARAGARVVGFEINPLLVLLSRYRIHRAGLSRKAKIYWSDFWHEDLSIYSLVTVFGISKMMPRLERKLKKELSANARIVSLVFKFPHLRPRKSKNGVFAYQIKQSRGNSQS